jgi:hypothetical protein
VTHEQPPVPKYALHRTKAEMALEQIGPSYATDSGAELAAVAQAHATLALVDLLRELRDDMRDLRRDVSRLQR